MIKLLLSVGADTEGNYVLKNIRLNSDQPAIIKAIEEAQAEKHGRK